MSSQRRGSRHHWKDRPYFRGQEVSLWKDKRGTDFDYDDETLFIRKYASYAWQYKYCDHAF
jgi:hypothetical protein